MGVIFFMSSQPQAESEAASNLATEIIYVLYAYLFPASHIDLSLFFEKYGQFIRKLAHFSEFVLLGVLVYSNTKEYIRKRPFVCSLLFSALYAASDEIHQLFVQGRFCSAKDILIDTAGALCGILLCHLITGSWMKKRNT